MSIFSCGHSRGSCCMMSIFSCAGRRRAESDDREELCHTTRKIIVVGDGEVGKTSLLMRFVTNEFDERYVPTIFENQAASTTVGNKKVMLNLFDTAGQETYEHLRPLMYPQTDVILICFSIDNPGSLTNVQEKWQPEVRAHLGKVPIVLLGLKSDLRCSDDFRSATRPQRTPSDSVNGNALDNGLLQRQSVSYADGSNMAAYIGAKAYFECSAKTNIGLTPIFQEAARLSLKTRRRSSIRDLFSPKRSSV